jgi:hypothetical protein
MHTILRRHTLLHFDPFVIFYFKFITYNHPTILQHFLLLILNLHPSKLLYFCKILWVLNPLHYFLSVFYVGLKILYP